MEHINGSLEKRTPAVSANFTPFTFVPILAKLPKRSTIINVGKKLLSSFNQNQSLAEPIKDTSDENTMDGGVYKAEFVYIRDPEESEPVDIPQETTHAKKPYKIKSAYKALAAIPTNTLLQEQQAIDNEVEKKENSVDPTEIFAMEEARAEMCSPAQLRAQSEELYAAIDEVLESPIPFRQPLLSPSPTMRWEENDSAKVYNYWLTRKYTPRSSPRTVGRETKYATYHLQSPGTVEQHVTKPGVIRPTSVTSKLPTDSEEEEYIPNPFKMYQNYPPRNNPKKFSSSLQGEPEADGGRPPSTQSCAKNDSSDGMKFGLLAPGLRLTSGEGSQTVPSTLTTSLAKMEVHETDI